jgi:uncharacterized membrane protein SirB2
VTYLVLKHVHVGCVLLSGLGFFLRGVLMWQGAAALQWRVTRVAPHLVDSLLLGSAVSLAVWSEQYPVRNDWLTAKMCGLLLYIVLGSVALKRGRTLGIRVSAFVLALLAFAYIVGVALMRNPWPF